MATSQVRLPIGTGHTGPLVPVRGRGEDSIGKQWWRVLPELPAVRSGFYRASSGAPVQLVAAAHAATGGFFWLLNPVDSPVVVDLTSVHFHTAAANPRQSSPRVTLERMTFTGASSASPVAVAKKRQAEPSPVALLVNATTGITPSAGAPVCAFLPVQAHTSTGHRANCVHLTEVRWRDDEGPILAAGEGVVLRQADAGDASEGARPFVVDFEWREYSSEF